MTVILGIDPGGTTGLCVVSWGPTWAWNRPWQVKNITPDQLVKIITDERDRARRDLIVACEAFVPSRGHRSTAGPRLTRDLIGAALSVDTKLTVVRPAGQVKPWATDKRLVVFGMNALRGLPHAADAARHALYAGVHDLGWPDPLLKLREQTGQ